MCNCDNNTKWSLYSPPFYQVLSQPYFLPGIIPTMLSTRYYPNPAFYQVLSQPCFELEYKRARYVMSCLWYVKHLLLQVNNLVFPLCHTDQMFDKAIINNSVFSCVVIKERKKKTTFNFIRIKLKYKKSKIHRLTRKQ